MRVHFLCHNHPALQPGGTEIFAHGLFRTLRDAHGVEGLFLAAVTGAHRERHPGTLLQAIGDAADEALAWLGHFDRFHLAQPDTYGLASLAPVIAALQPDIVHIHHLLQLGLETVDLIRRAAPRARLVFTAHDYFALCPQEGQLMTANGRLCPAGPSLDRCQACFPDRPGADLVMRDLAVRDALGEMDVIRTPGSFARERYLQARWPADRLRVMPNGIAQAVPAPHRAAPDGRRDRFAMFGHMNRFKGVLPLLGASRRLTAAGVVHRVTLHGGAAYQSDVFWEEFRAALAAAPDVSWQDGDVASLLPGLMARTDWVVVPSIWWENAPLVIQEAFLHRRPVICGDIGGMARMVTDGIDGLHAPVGDPAGLAGVLRRAAGEPGLWDRLVAGIRAPHALDAAAEAHLALYRELLAAAPPARRRTA